MKLNRTWMIVSLLIIGNICIFYFMSKRLESYVEGIMINKMLSVQQ